MPCRRPACRRGRSIVQPTSSRTRTCATRDDLQTVHHPAAGTYEHYKTSIHHMSKTPLPIRKHAALLGQDNEYVYKEVCGYTDEEYAWFVENGHAGTTVVAKQKGPGR